MRAWYKAAFPWGESVWGVGNLGSRRAYVRCGRQDGPINYLFTFPTWAYLKKRTENKRGRHRATPPPSPQGEAARFGPGAGIDRVP